MTVAFGTSDEVSIDHSPAGVFTFPVKILSGVFSYLAQRYNAVAIKKIVKRVAAVRIFFIIVFSLCDVFG